MDMSDVWSRVFKHDIRDNSLYKEGMVRPASKARDKDKVEGLGLWIMGYGLWEVGSQGRLLNLEFF